MGIQEMKDLQQAKAEKETISKAEAKARIAEMQKELEAIERKEGRSGAVPLGPKGKLLEANEVEDALPHKRLRWVNINSDKAQIRQNTGYERVAIGDGGRQVGNLALFAIDRQEYERRVELQAEVNRKRLEAHKAEVSEMAESVAKLLRDRHGVNVNPRDFMINEGG
jgi:hypothetical protein